MANPNDAGNPLLSTPVATIAVDFFLEAIKHNRAPTSWIGDLAQRGVDFAETIVSELQTRGHLPGTLAEVEQPKADDATLILQALMLGLAEWRPFAPGDPRGELIFDGMRHGGKLSKGIPVLSRDTIAELTEFVAPELRKL